MIPNLLNTLLGIWVVYAAVLNLRELEVSEWTLIVTGAVAIGLAAWARRTDYAKWHSTTNVVLGIALILMGVAQFSPMLESLTFWIAFWAGMAIAIIALWAALYRPGVGAH